MIAMVPFSALANPHRFMSFSDRMLPWMGWLTALLLVTGFIWGLFFAPPDYQMGESARIMFVHVPSAWLSMFAYAVLAGASLMSLIWRHNLADMAAKSAAPLGAAFTFLGLVTGALWGQPMWGTFWEWDARLTSMLVLFFIYLGYIALWETIEDQQKAARAAAILAIVGSINAVIVKFSVDWWNTLHQPASLSRLDAPAMHWSFWVPLLICALGYTMLFLTLLFVRMRTEVMRNRIRRLRMKQVGA